MKTTHRPLTLSRTLRAWALLVPCLTGCAMAGHDAIPAPRLAPEFRAPSRRGQMPMDFTRLRLQPNESYVLGPRDLLGVFIQDVLPVANDQRISNPVVNNAIPVNRDYYPAKGFVQVPLVGVPTEIQSNGMIELPHIAPLQLTGLNLQQASDLIRETYRKEQIIAPGKERVVLTVIRPRVHRVLVIREDVAPPPALTRRDSYFVGKRGSAEVIDLPSQDNDVLHALIASGGLPGKDAFNAVWIMRSRPAEDGMLDTMQSVIAAGGDTQKLLYETRVERSHIRIPLRVTAVDQCNLTPADITLNDGDIVFLESRDHEVFYVGGFIPGAQIPLPRDYDVDILHAIALGTGSVAGPPGGGANTVFRSGSGPGNIVPPTRALVSRTLADGRIVKIRVNVTRALNDPTERLIIQPNDVIVLQYTPTEVGSNLLLNLFQFNITFVPGS